jgi:hypothetical protein
VEAALTKTDDRGIGGLSVRLSKLLASERERTLTVLAATALAVIAVAWVPARLLAAPAPFEGVRASCPGIGDTILTSPGNGLFTPGFIEGTHDLLVQHAVDVVITGPDGSTTVSGAKAGPTPGDAVICTIDMTFHSGGQAYTIIGTMAGVVVGKP